MPTCGSYPADTFQVDHSSRSSKGLQHVEIDIHSYNDAHPSNMPFQSAPWHLGPLHDLEAFKHEGGVEWLKKTGLRSVRFTVSIATGGTPTDELRDSHHGVY